MEIIKRYKEQIQKSLYSLEEEGVLSKQELQESKLIIEQDQNQNQNHTQQSTAQQTSQQQQIPLQNPYLRTHDAGDRFGELGKCSVCFNPSKYRCPQCLVSYCSSSHYKSHNLYCSQQFFKVQVQSKLKNMKASKDQKRRTLQMLKQHNQLQAESQRSQLNQFGQERLAAMLQMIEECQRQGKQVKIQDLKLTQEEEQALNQYIEKVVIQEDKQVALNKQNSKSQIKQNTQLSYSSQSPNLVLPQKQPYWTIPQGLQFYYMFQLQIQQFSKSQYPEFIVYRQLAAKRWKQTPQISELMKLKLTSLFEQQILQYLTIWVTVYLSYGGQIKQNTQQIIKIIDQIYVKDLVKDLTQTNISINQACQYTLARLNGNILLIKNDQIKQLLLQWSKTLVFPSCKMIVKNNYLLVESIIRLLQVFQSQYQHISSNKQVNDKRNKRELNSMTKHIKKLQLILSYIKYQIKNKQANNQNIDSMTRRLYRAFINEQERINIQTKEEDKIKSIKKNIKEVNQQGILFKKE